MAATWYRPPIWSVSIRYFLLRREQIDASATPMTDTKGIDGSTFVTPAAVIPDSKIASTGMSSVAEDMYETPQLRSMMALDGAADSMEEEEDIVDSTPIYETSTGMMSMRAPKAARKKKKPPASSKTWTDEVSRRHHVTPVQGGRRSVPKTTR